MYALDIFSKRTTAVIIYPVSRGTLQILERDTSSPIFRTVVCGSQKALSHVGM